MPDKLSKDALREVFRSGEVPTGDQFRQLIASLADDLPPKTEEVVSGAITVSRRQIRVDTEDQSAADDLETINGMSDGEIVILSAANPARPVTVKSTGNIDIASDLALDAWRKNIVLWYNASQGKLNELSRVAT